jgi:hypothetical protein
MITDEDLLLYYYRDGLEAAERARIGTALGEQPELAQRLHRLVARLDAAAVMPEVPVPAHIKQRWRSALDRAAHGISTRAAPIRDRSFGNPRWQAAAAAAVLVLALTIQFAMQSSPDRTVEDATPPTTGTVASTHAGTAYARGLRLHLASTERELTRLGSATPDERARLIEAIMEENLMYALAADRAGEPELARVLRAFAPILESLAHDSGETPLSIIARLNFELRVLQARLKAGSQKPSSAQPMAL